MYEPTIGPIRLDPAALYDGYSVRLLLGISEHALRQARSSGALRSVIRGRRRFYRGDWILVWLNDAEVNPNAPTGPTPREGGGL